MITVAGWRHAVEHVHKFMINRVVPGRYRLVPGGIRWHPAVPGGGDGRCGAAVPGGRRRAAACGAVGWGGWG
ncbi:hypothetical protein Cs7R123_34260 [Catellatospora sp. TT07R-123]|nr:hypothetical protein Cs7R123_34260 [Catellatospora sp. TT07R-123]